MFSHRDMERVLEIVVQEGPGYHLVAEFAIVYMVLYL